MDKVIKEILEVVIQVKRLAEANNELLGFICQKISPVSTKKEYLDTKDFMIASLEMSEMFEEYDIMPEDYGIS